MERNRIIILATIISMLALSANAQEEKNTRKGFLIKYDLISLLGDQVSNSMGVRLGFERMTVKDQSIAADIMYIFPCKNCGEGYTKIETEKTVGFLISASYCFYLFNREVPFNGFHLGPQLAYQYTRAELFETYNEGVPNTYEVYRNMLTVHAMAGYQIRIAGSIYFDPALGLGFRYISSRNENKKGSDPGQHEFPYDKDYESGAAWFPSIDISIKIGIKL